MMWKTLMGRCIHNGLNGAMVRQNLAYRWLTLGSDALQTLINRRHPERDGLQYIPALTMAAHTHPATSCLLGLGGAGVAHALAPYFHTARLDAVESNMDVIEIASNYFMTNQLKHLNIIHQDASLFVKTTQLNYQHVMVDLFNAHTFPEHCNTSDFFADCRRILLPEGILAVNLANMHEQWPIFLLIREHFQLCTLAIPVKGTANMVVLAYKGASVKPLLELCKHSFHKVNLAWDSKWGCIAEFNKRKK